MRVVDNIGGDFHICEFTRCRLSFSVSVLFDVQSNKMRKAEVIENE